MHSLSQFIIPAAILLAALGCTTSTTPATPPVATESAHEAEHEHAHSHSHEEAGPHGGHVVPLGKEEYHLEWLHDDATGKVTAYVLDGAAKEEVLIDDVTILINVKVQESIPYLLVAVGDAPKSSQFEIEDPGLVESLKMAGEGVEVTTEVKIGENTYAGKIEHHHHEDGHGHKH